MTSPRSFLVKAIKIGQNLIILSQIPTTPFIYKSTTWKTAENTAVTPFMPLFPIGVVSIVSSKEETEFKSLQTLPL